MSHVIHPGFLEFLKQLEAKEEGKPLLLWEEHLDFLTAFIGPGDCRNYVLGGFVAPYLDIVYKLRPEEGEDAFVGFHISGGIQRILKQSRKEELGKKYEAFRMQHNRMRYEYHASELLDTWLTFCPPTAPDKIELIRRYLQHQNPSVHIPLPF